MGEQVITKEKEAADPKVAEEEKKITDEPAAAAEETAAASDDPAAAGAGMIVLGVEVHCTGCAKRIKRSILRFCKQLGGGGSNPMVESVETDMAANTVTVKLSAGAGAVDPQALCARLRERTKRNATVIFSPAADVTPKQQEEAITTIIKAEDRSVELLVKMHCEACAGQLQRKMLRMKGVRSATTDLAAGKLTVVVAGNGVVSDEDVVEFIHRRTGKIATAVPAADPEPEPCKEEDANKDAAAAAPADDKKEEEEKLQPEEEKKKEGAPAGDDEKQEDAAVVDGFPQPAPAPEEMMKRAMLYWPPPTPYSNYNYYYKQHQHLPDHHAQAMAAMPPHPAYAMMHHQHQWTPPPPPPAPAVPMPSYYGSQNNYMMMMERPPQMFSDENPNACVIS